MLFRDVNLQDKRHSYDDVTPLDDVTFTDSAPPRANIFFGRGFDLEILVSTNF